MYSNIFNGWTGHLDTTWSKENREELFTSLSSLYHSHMKSGQKLFVGFDGNQNSRYLAIRTAETLSAAGIPVLVSSRPLTSSLLQLICNERYGSGTITFLSDELSTTEIGLKATLSSEIIVTPDLIKGLKEVSLKKKRYKYEYFDPTSNIRNYLESKVTFLKSKHPMNNILWNAMRGPSSPLLEEIFTSELKKESIDAYTINSLSNLLYEDAHIEMDFQSEVINTTQTMEGFQCDYGITTTSDLNVIDVLVKEKNGIRPLSLAEIVSRIRPYFNSEGNTTDYNIVVSESLNCINDFRNEFGDDLDSYKEPKFKSILMDKTFLIAVDKEENIYINSERFPNKFVIMLTLFHSLLFTNQKNTLKRNIKKQSHTIKPEV